MLSGGAARGAAQVGMLRVLLQHGVFPDVMVAGSVGAINATFLAQDVSLEQVDRLEAIYHGLGNYDLIGTPQAMVLNVLRRRPSLASGDRIRDFIAGRVLVERVEDLPLPVRVATFDLEDGRFTWHDAGNLVDVVAASCAIPAIYPPVEISGHLQVDYGVRFHVPTDAAVDLARPGDTVWSLEVNRVPVPRAMRSPWDALMIVAGASISQNSMREFPAGVALHRMVLDRDFDTGFAFNFAHTERLVRMGQEVAEAVVDGAGVAVGSDQLAQGVAAQAARNADASTAAADPLQGLEARRGTQLVRYRRVPALAVAMTRGAAARTREAALTSKVSLSRLARIAQHPPVGDPATERIA